MDHAKRSKPTRVSSSPSATFSKGSVGGKQKVSTKPVYSSQSNSMHFAGLICTFQLQENVAEANAGQVNLVLSTRDREEKASSFFLGQLQFGWGTSSRIDSVRLNNRWWNKGISGEKSSYLNYIHTRTGVKHGASFGTPAGKHAGGLRAAPALPSRSPASPAMQQGQGALQRVWTWERGVSTSLPRWASNPSTAEMKSPLTRGAKGFLWGNVNVSYFAS